MCTQLTLDEVERLSFRMLTASCATPLQAMPATAGWRTTYALPPMGSTGWTS